MSEIELKGKKVLVMGLGLHGGGLASVRYLLKAGAKVICTDLRTPENLKPSLDALAGEELEFVLGEHRMEDFDRADLIVKNPAVPSDSKWIAGRNNIETDISLFLQASSSPIIAVTGSKGKSTVVTALHNILIREFPGARLGGNITVSPLSFLDELTPDTPVVLELSSWQLADLRGRNILHPRIACITNLMHDHQNRYASFSDYEADKMVIFESLPSKATAVFPDDERGRKWAGASPSPSVLIGTEDSPFGEPYAFLDGEGRGWYSAGGKNELILPADLRVPGKPFRTNMLFASLLARLWGCNPEGIVEAQRNFGGVPYRMELFLEWRGIQFYDDTAATIPDAAAAAVQAMKTPVILVAGGTDKELDFSPFDEIAGTPKSIVLLEGSATETLIPRLRKSGARIKGPYNNIDEAVRAALADADSGDSVLLSPGAASFGMFRHEFERGDAFKRACREAVKNS